MTEISYPYFVPFGSENEAQAKIEDVNEHLRPTWTDGTTNNYDIPKEGVSGKWWVIVNQITERMFTPEQLEAKKYPGELQFKSTGE